MCRKNYFLVQLDGVCDKCSVLNEPLFNTPFSLVNNVSTIQIPKTSSVSDSERDEYYGKYETFFNISHPADFFFFNWKIGDGW